MTYLEGSDSPTYEEHQAIENLLGAYALDAVEPDEAELVEEHLRTCPRCRAEVDAHHEMAAAMGTSVEPVSLELWDRIAARLSEREGGPVDAADPAMPWLGSAPTADAGPVGPTEGAVLIDLAQARRRRQRTWRRVTAVVGVASAVVIAVLAFNLVQSKNNATQLQSALSGKGDSSAVATALANPNHKIVVMRSPDGAQLAEFVMVPGGHGYLTSSNMQALPADETYQLWATIDGQPISIGLLGNNVRTAAFTIGGTASPSNLAITVEPAGGVVAPDRSPVAKGTVA